MHRAAMHALVLPSRRPTPSPPAARSWNVAAGTVRSYARSARLGIEMIHPTTSRRAGRGAGSLNASFISLALPIILAPALPSNGIPPRRTLAHRICAGTRRRLRESAPDLARPTTGSRGTWEREERPPLVHTFAAARPNTTQRKKRAPVTAVPNSPVDPVLFAPSRLSPARDISTIRPQGLPIDEGKQGASPPLHSALAGGESPGANAPSTYAAALLDLDRRQAGDIPSRRTSVHHAGAPRRPTPHAPGRTPIALRVPIFLLLPSTQTYPPLAHAPAPRAPVHPLAPRTPPGTRALHAPQYEGSARSPAGPVTTHHTPFAAPGAPHCASPYALAPASPLAPPHAGGARPRPAPATQQARALLAPSPRTTHLSRPRLVRPRPHPDVCSPHRTPQGTQVVLAHVPRPPHTPRSHLAPPRTVTHSQHPSAGTAADSGERVNGRRRREEEEGEGADGGWLTSSSVRRVVVLSARK
ncbi:hypothetical protein DFH06DRAFT_1488107 [Mycena polygramma]|nr:hypothetical protein DFH06DRAFT_1488107 [Mycena polygramma]